LEKNVRGRECGWTEFHPAGGIWNKTGQQKF
jgi:hypothetical protein